MKLLINKFFKSNCEKAILETDKIMRSIDDWYLLNINQNYINQSPLTKELDLHHSGKLIQYKFAENSKSIFASMHENQRLIYSSDSRDNLIFRDKFYHLIDLEIKYFIEHFGNILNSKRLINQMNSEVEAKSHEWIRVSFKILKEAILKAQEDITIQSSLKLFFGKNPKHQMLEFRLMIYNLDITYILLNDGNLRIKIFNDKTGQFSSPSSPVLQGDFSILKREMFEEFIQRLICIKPLIQS